MPKVTENTKFITIRFNLENPLHLKAWDYLMNSKGDIYKSYSEAALSSIIESVERKLLLEKDAYFETRQKEDDFVNKIVAAVGERLEKEIPNFILSCIANFATAKYTSLAESRQEENSENTAENSDIDWDFLGDE